MARYPDPASRSAVLFERAQAVLPGGNSRQSVYRAPYPIYIRSAKGALVTDVDGVERTDFLNNFTSLIHGHAHGEVMRVVAEQLPLGSCYAGPTEAEIMLAELLCERLPSADRVRFANSGTEAVMMAIKAARAHTGRPKIAKSEGAYHGTYDYAEVSEGVGPQAWSAGDPSAVAGARGTPDGVLKDVVVMPFNDAAAAERILTPEAGKLAAIVIDPLPNRCGLMAASREYLTFLRDFAERHGIVLIYDEVISFRIGYHGAQGVFGVLPDLTALGKIIGGGFPVGAVAGREAIMAVFDPRASDVALPHAGTFNANPITMVAGLATMRLLDETRIAALNALGEKTREALRAAMTEAGVSGQVTGAGSLFRLYLNDRPLKDYRSAFVDADEKARMARLSRYFLNRGFMLAPYGMGNLSTAIDEADIARLATVLRDGLRALQRNTDDEEFGPDLNSGASTHG
jgi:glutamate-1-semialdehyde 2,1-aminomutase